MDTIKTHGGKTVEVRQRMGKWCIHRVPGLDGWTVTLEGDGRCAAQRIPTIQGARAIAKWCRATFGDGVPPATMIEAQYAAFKAVRDEAFAPRTKGVKGCRDLFPRAKFATADKLDRFMREELDRQSLRASCSRKMMCECGQILCCTRDVEATLLRNGEVQRVIVACLACWRKRGPELVAKTTAPAAVADGFELDVIRGKADW